MFSIVIPLFNEEENIISLLDEIYLELKNIQKYEIVLVNDCSTDNTLELQFGAGISDKSDEEIIPNPDNIGLGICLGLVFGVAMQKKQSNKEKETI